MSNLWSFVALALAFAAVWLALVQGPRWRLKARINARLNRRAAGDEEVARSWIFGLATWYTELAAVRGDYQEMAESLEITGRTDERIRTDYLLMCWLMPALAILFGFALTGVIWGTLVAVVAFLLPRRLIRSMAVAAEKQQNLEAIELCHMTRMLMEAGLSIERALRLASVQARPVMPMLSGRLDRFNRMMEAGADRTEALDELGRNRRILVLRNYVALMKQSSKLGARVSGSLDQIIHEAQQNERSRLKEDTNRIGAKMTIIMMVFMLPALFTLIGGPAVMSIAETLGR
ncbi:type II secretion system F family protein [Marinobacter sp. SS21]|uniref:type II secretion system F family protein n=1 Tax=Marinobacter sp. SS21 TaxID=2979460 RepID=UPI00232E967A|nr:type II secretion system F family protein [Marinobacter sp. SS21]MDC0661256.1 type II secretion system F family protein [Marinobacter sp. SS21]